MVFKTSITFNQVKLIKAKTQKHDSEKEIKNPKFRDFLPIFVLALIVLFICLISEHFFKYWNILIVKVSGRMKIYPIKVTRFCKKLCRLYSCINLIGIKNSAGVVWCYYTLLQKENTNLIYLHIIFMYL